jgi:hypothetical protein
LKLRVEPAQPPERDALLEPCGQAEPEKETSFMEKDAGSMESASASGVGREKAMGRRKGRMAVTSILTDWCLGRMNLLKGAFFENNRRKSDEGDDILSG